MSSAAPAVEAPVTPAKVDIPVVAPVAPASSLTAPLTPVAPAAPDFAAKVKSAKNPLELKAALAELNKPAPAAPPTPEPAAEVPAVPAEEPTPGADPETPETPADETPAEPGAETPEDPDDEPPGDGPVKAITAKKWRDRLPEDDEVGRLAAELGRRNRDWTARQRIDEAEKRLGIKPAKPTADPTPEPAKSDLPETVEATNAAIAALRAERKKANTELRFEEASDLSDKLEDMISHRADLGRAQERQQIEATRTYETGFAKSEQKAAELYDFATKPDSDGGKRMKEIDRLMETEGDPLYHSPDKPLRIAQMVAAELSIAPRKKGATPAPAKAAAPTPPPAAPAAKRQVLPSGGSRTVVPNGNQPPAVVENITNAKSMLDLKKGLRAIGVRV